MGNKYSYVIANITTNNYAEVLKGMEHPGKRSIPEHHLFIHFWTRIFRRTMKRTNVHPELSGYFTVVAILIACLGLFGLSAFSAEQRMKEIGIRKVLGASVMSIVALLSKEFIRIVLIAIFIATPMAWYIMNKWLEGFEYKIPIHWWMFALTGFLAIFIALVYGQFSGNQSGN